MIKISQISRKGAKQRKEIEKNLCDTLRLCERKSHIQSLFTIDSRRLKDNKRHFFKISFFILLQVSNSHVVMICEHREVSKCS